MKWLILLTAALLSGCAVHGPGGSIHGAGAVYGSTVLHGGGSHFGTAPYLQPDPYFVHGPTHWLGGPAFSTYGHDAHIWPGRLPQVVVPPVHVQTPRGHRPHGPGPRWSGRDRDQAPGWRQREPGGSGWRDRPHSGGDRVTPPTVAPRAERDSRSMRPRPQRPEGWQRPAPGQRSEGRQGRRGGSRP